MVVILKVVVYYGVVDMVCPYEMLECPRTLLWSCLNIVNVDGGYFDGLGRICACCEVSMNTADQRHPCYHRGRHDGRIG